MQSVFQKYSAWRRKVILAPRRSMTIGIGIICGDCIMLACDSQTTVGVSKISGQKLEIIDFADSRIVLTYANFDDPAQMAIDCIRRRARDQKIENTESVKTVCIEGLKDVRKHFWELDKLDRLTDDQLADYFRKKDCTLLIGFYCNRKPNLFRIDLSQCIARDAKSHVESIGVGGELGHYLLAELVNEDLVFGEAYPLAIHIVEQVIAHVEGCGYPTRVGLVFPVPEFELKMKRDAAVQRRKEGRTPWKVFEAEGLVIPQWRVDLVVRELKTGERELEAARRQYNQQVMDRVTKQTLDKIAEEDVQQRIAEESDDK